MIEHFTNYDVYKYGKMIKLNQHQTQQSQAWSSSCASDPSTQQEDNWSYFQEN